MIRTGAGISVDPNTFRYLRDDYPATISTQYSGANAYSAAGTLRTGIPSVVGPDLNQTSFVLPAAVGTTRFPQIFKRGCGQPGHPVHRDSEPPRRRPGGGNPGRYLFRKFKMTERFVLEIRCEMFGVTNTPQFGNPGATVSSLTRNANSTITSASGERQARFAARITF